MRTRTLRASVVAAVTGVSTLLASVASVGPASAQNNSIFVELSCTSYGPGVGGAYCTTVVYSGDTVTYSWIGATPFEFDPASATADCAPGQYAYVEVLVTDSNGNTGGAWTRFWC